MCLWSRQRSSHHRQREKTFVAAVVAAAVADSSGAFQTTTCSVEAAMSGLTRQPQKEHQRRMARCLQPQGCCLLHQSHHRQTSLECWV